MKSTLFLTFSIFLIRCLSLYAQSSIQSISFDNPSNKSYLNFSENNSPLDQLEVYLKEGSWQLLRQAFKNENDYSLFMDNFISDRENTSLSLLKRVKPFVFDHREGQDVYLLNLKDSSKAKLTFTFLTTSSKIIIEKVTVSLLSKVENTSNLRTASEVQNPLFVLLPSSLNDEAKYYDSYLEDYNKNYTSNTSQISTGIPFRQIDFSPLNIKFRWCRKVAFINICGDITKQFTYGKVISGIDIPGNETQFQNKYFGNVCDLTSFTAQFGTTAYLEHSYIQTAIVVDDVYNELTFFREGLEPWKYKPTDPAYQFRNIVAVKAIGGFIYVLDNGAGIFPPDIKVLKLIHTTDGNYNISTVGKINNTNLGVTFSNSTDISGYEDPTGNILLVADGYGIYKVQLGVDGLPSSLAKVFTKAQDPFNLNQYYSLTNVRRLDASAESGSIVVLTNQDEIISFSSSELSINNSAFVRLSYYSDLSALYYPTNLGYMATEHKWYVTDKTGRMHILSKDGKYISTGGSYGTSEV